MKKNCFHNKRILFLSFILLIHAQEAKAQPGLPDVFFFNLFFTLPPEIGVLFENGEQNINDLKIRCEYFQGSISYPANKDYNKIIFMESSLHAPAQIGHSDGFESYSGRISFDSVLVRYQWNDKVYRKIVRPAKEDAYSGCIRDFGAEFSRLSSSICQTHTLYHTGRPQADELRRLIRDQKLETQRIVLEHPSPTRLLKVFSSDQKPLYPLVIANGDTCGIIEGRGIDAIVLPFDWDNQKIQLRVFHPDYPSLILDSVSRYSCLGFQESIYLPKEDESYFLDGGKPMPLKHGYRELAVLFDPSTSANTIDSIVHELTKHSNLQLSKNWRTFLQREIDSLGLDYVESKYGSLNRHLNHMVQFKLYGDWDYNPTFNLKEFDEIKAVNVPLSFYRYLLPQLTIIFKEGLSVDEIDQFEKEQLPDFMQIGDDSHLPLRTQHIQKSYAFHDWLYIPNHFKEVLMKDPRVSYCGDVVYEYTLTED
jgi:hypothetical protein